MADPAMTEWERLKAIEAAAENVGQAFERWRREREFPAQRELGESLRALKKVLDDAS